MFRKNTSGISLVVIPQVRNFEDEIRRACGIKDVRKITGSRSIRDFKRDILK